MSEHQGSHVHEKSATVEMIKSKGRITKVAIWPELRSGDCHEIGGTITFDSEGFGTFECTNWTDSTQFGDVWHASFYLYTAGGQLIGTLGGYDSPPLYVGRRVDWTASFTFVASEFNEIDHVTQKYSA